MLKKTAGLLEAGRSPESSQKLKWSLCFSFSLCGSKSHGILGQGFLVRFGVRTEDNGIEMSTLLACMWG